MAAFRYKHGDRPLEGYTIQRGAGRGGFGEVYYAVSDSGREVALKVVQGYEQIELRGVSQCMNLKSPNLVTIFDVRYNNDGTPFVIMEFVAGPSLRQILDESPAGIGTQKTAFFLREMAKGLTFLHDCGIVHRDLKPGNIFYENGCVKIGDYGLSKTITADHRSEQTVTVGTVHYMAPEIGAGRYDRSIDIYALGAIVYEMLTGQTPYLGGSAGEILMKHMTAEPDVSGIEEPFATVIRRAMAKDPAQRYQSVQEMVEAVFGSEHVRQSMSCFSPDSLSMVAARVAERVVAGGGGSSGGGVSGATPRQDYPARDSDVWARMGDLADRAGNRVSQIGGRLRAVKSRFLANRACDRVAPDPETAAAEARDPIPGRQRRLLALMSLAGISVGAGVFAGAGQRGDEILPLILFVFTASLGAWLGIRLARRKLGTWLVHESKAMQHFVFGGLAGIFCAILSVALVAAASDGGGHQYVVQSWVAVFAMLILADWRSALAVNRAERVDFGRLVMVGLFGFLASIILGGSAVLVIGILCATHIAAQVASPWDPSAAARKRPAQPVAPAAGIGSPVPPAPGPAMPPPLPVRFDAAPAPAMRAPAPIASAYARVPDYVRSIWLGAMVATITGGVLLVVAGGTVVRNDSAQAGAIAFGIGMLFIALFSLVRACTKRFRGWWYYLVRPALVYACIQSVLVAGILMGNTRMNNDEWLLALFFIIFPVALFPVLLAIRVRPRHAGMRLGEQPAAVPVPIMPMADFQPPPAVAIEPAPSWTPPPAAAEAAIAPVERRPFQFGVLWAVPGVLAFVAAALLGLAAALDVPGFVGAGIPDPRLAQELNKQFGSTDWPSSLRVLGYVLAYAGMFFAAVLLMAGRRSRGPWHMVRVPLGIAGFLFGQYMLGVALFSRYGPNGGWAHVRLAAGGPFPGACIERCIHDASPSLAIFALVLLCMGLMVLLWQPHERRSQPSSLPKEGA
ncbi:MAG: serine/threonine-protein kinase [Tepidisphaerales bacterium]